jgi:pyruvate, orthophosphate dikinase
MNQRAITYRRLHNIPESWGTAVNVQAMVFGNMGEDSATGVAFTRDPSTGEKALYGEFLVNAQGEDVVAGIRTPQDLTEAARKKAGSDKPSLETLMPGSTRNSFAPPRRSSGIIATCRTSNSPSSAASCSCCRRARASARPRLRCGSRSKWRRRKLITRDQAVARIDPAALDQLLHPTLDPERTAYVIATGLPASPGAASGEITFSADEAEALKAQGRKVVLVRIETSPEDIHGMHAAEGISDDARRHDFARGRGGARHGQALRFRRRQPARRLRQARIDCRHAQAQGGRHHHDRRHQRARCCSARADAAAGTVRRIQYADAMGGRSARSTCAPMPTRRPTRARRAISARKGIGLCRTEHMFFDADRILAVREMILADDETGRRAALAKLLPMQRDDFVAVRDDAGTAGHDPAARSAAARIPAAWRGRDREVSQAMGTRIPTSCAARAGTVRIQPDARLSRLPARHRLSRNRRDAGARDLRGGDDRREEDRQSRSCRKSWCR